MSAVQCHKEGEALSQSQLTPWEDSVQIWTPHAWNEDRLRTLHDVACARTRNGRQTVSALLQVDRVAVQVRHGRRDGADPAGVRVNHARPNRGAGVQAELGRCLLRETRADGLAGREDESGLAGLAA